jgi:UDP-3-O-[3-hydroxymyristoyl] N-acetylglucosamine deacetylase
MLAEKPSKDIYQRTLKQPVSFVGLGLHSGRKVSMVVRPGRVNSGIHFLRKDAPAGEGTIPARWYDVIATDMSTTLGNECGYVVGTAEHLLAALRGCGIDNAIVELDGPEVPVMDGSAAPFTAMIEQVGTVVETALRRFIVVRRPIRVTDGDKFAILTPDTRSRITVEIDFPGTAVGYQRLSLTLEDDTFARQLAHARTFGFAEQIAGLRQRGLALGGSTRNAILVDGQEVVNEEGLRFKDEFVRHKVLDALGDLSLAGAPVLGHYYAYKPGHRLNTSLLREMFAMRDAWDYATFPPREVEAVDTDQLGLGGGRTAAD